MHLTPGISIVKCQGLTLQNKANQMTNKEAVVKIMDVMCVALQEIAGAPILEIGGRNKAVWMKEQTTMALSLCQGVLNQTTDESPPEEEPCVPGPEEEGQEEEAGNAVS